MSSIPSVSVGVSKILGAEPDQSIETKIWQELIKLRVALLNLAAAVDARNAAALEAAQISTYQTTGLLEHSMHLGQLTTLTVIAGEELPKYPSFCTLSFSGGVLKATKSHRVYADALSVQADSVTPAGSTRDVILRGLYLNSVSTFDPISYAVPYPHYRLAVGTTEAKYDNGAYAGKPFWFSNRTKERYEYFYIEATRYTGHVIGSMVAESNTDPTGSYFQHYAMNALVYFNPRRV